MATYGRSPQEINDDTLLEWHTLVTEDLNAMSCGCCLYTGTTRRFIEESAAQLEDKILFGGELRQGWFSHYCAVVHRI